MLNIILFILLGLTAGVISGVAGIGGGIIIIPALVYIFGFSQKLAQGTTLALMIPPIGLLAAYTYYKSGFVDLKVALFICLGFFFGGLLGSKVAISLPTQILQKVFASLMIAIGFYMFFFKK